MAQFISFFSETGSIPLSRITLVGHSAGAQIAGIAGRALKGKIGTIFGLDPAWSQFDLTPNLMRSDARYVQIIMTTAHLIGVATPSAHQVFYPNGGKVPQPGCGMEQLFCAHLRSIHYFIASLNPENNFRARRCNKKHLWVVGFCKPIFDRLGPHSKRLRGDFYLRTNGSAPFALGAAGTSAW